jgi:GTP-binding protein
VLLIVLDLAALDGTSPAGQLEILERELGAYQPELLERPRMVIGSRSDLVVGDDSAVAAADAAGVEMRISAATRSGVHELVQRLAGLVDEARAAEAAAASGEIVIHRPAPEGVAVVRLDAHEWRLEGRAAERAVAFSDLTDEGALDEAVRRLRRLGVDRALSRAGAHDGDEVHVGDISFTWYRDGSEGMLEPEQPEATGAGRRGRAKGGRRA